MRLLKQLWHDDGGALVATEYLLLMTLLILGVVTGLVSLRQAVIGEFADMGESIMSVSQSYHWDGQQNRHAFTAGSFYLDPGVDPTLRPWSVEPTDWETLREIERRHGIDLPGSPVD